VIKLKSPTDVERLAEGGAILAEVLDILETKVVAGVLPIELDTQARQLLADRDCVPAFLNYSSHGSPIFTAALCVSVNDGIVHGLPDQTPIMEGDAVGIDLGLIYQGKYFLDSARTVMVGAVSPEVAELVAVTKQALAAGIKKATVGNSTHDMRAAVVTFAQQHNYGVVRELVGHGVGFAVHEEPHVPNYGNPGEGHRLEEGLVIAIEPMFTLGKPGIKTARDGWTVITADGSMAAHAEHTVAVTKEGPRILTPTKK